MITLCLVTPPSGVTQVFTDRLWCLFLNQGQMTLISVWFSCTSHLLKFSDFSQHLNQITKTSQRKEKNLKSQQQCGSPETASHSIRNSPAETCCPWIFQKVGAPQSKLYSAQCWAIGAYIRASLRERPLFYFIFYFFSEFLLIQHEAFESIQTIWTGVNGRPAAGSCSSCEP